MMGGMITLATGQRSCAFGGSGCEHRAEANLVRAEAGVDRIHLVELVGFDLRSDLVADGQFEYIAQVVA